MYQAQCGSAFIGDYTHLATPLSLTSMHVKEGVTMEATRARLWGSKAG